MNSFCHEKQTVLPNPNIFNPNKNNIGTNMFELTKFDCIWLVIIVTSFIWLLYKNMHSNHRWAVDRGFWGHPLHGSITVCSFWESKISVRIPRAL